MTELILIVISLSISWWCTTSVQLVEGEDGKLYIYEDTEL